MLHEAELLLSEIITVRVMFLHVSRFWENKELWWL